MPGWRKSGTIGRITLAGIVILGLSRVALAEPEGVRIDYAAPAGCPDTAAFLHALRERTTRFREAAPDEPARKFIVRVRPVGSAFSGRLEIRGPDARPAVRTVDAAICQEVAGALALITALTIDPHALTGTPKVVEPGEVDAPSQLPIGTDRPGDSPVGTAEWSRPWRWSAGLSGHMIFLEDPSRGWGGELFVEAGVPVFSKREPALRLAIGLTQSDVDVPLGAGARFRWARVGIEGCPVRLGGTRLTLHPCVAFRLGSLQGEGRNISHPARSISLWSEAGLLLRGRWALTSRLSLEGQGGILLPLRRPAFEIMEMGTSATVYSVPRWGGSAGIGIAYKFQ